MYKTEKVERIVELSLLTGFLDEDVPVSLMLIADSEHAKTSILRGFKCYKTIETADISPKVISKKIVPLLKVYKIHHLVIPDMVKVLSHKAATVDSIVAFLNALMEEGITKNMFFGQEFEFDAPRTCGILTSVTCDFFRNICKKWHEIGFTSRFIPISYQYSDETKKEIHKLIQGNVFFKDVIELGNEHKSLFNRKFVIPIPDDIASWVSLHAQDVAEKEGSYSFNVFVQGGNRSKVNLRIMGFRLHRQLRQLLRAEALRRTFESPVVTWKDVEEVNGLLEYIRFPDNPKVL